MNSTHIKSFFARYWVLLVVIIIKFILQFVLVNPIYELHRDEFLHLDQAFHPAAGYISVPPFTSWMASLIYAMGGGLFWIRFVPALFGALTIVFAWLIVEELGGKLAAKILTSTLLVFSIYPRLNVLFQPISFDILVWTIIFYFLIKYIIDNNKKWLFSMSVIIALGINNKYTLLFFILGLLVGLLITQQRRVFFKRNFYCALVLSLLLILPNIIWQIVNHFPVIHHIQALKESQLVNIDRIDFLFDQVKFGVIGIPTMIALWALLFYKPFKPYRFVLWTFLIIMSLFTITRAKSYYALGLYPVLFAFGSVYMEVLFKKWKAIPISLIMFLHIAAFFLVVKYLMPFQNPSEIIKNQESYEKIGLLRWEDGLDHPLPQDFADMLGWKEMAEKALLAYKMLPARELHNTIIFCDNYGQAGALNYYNRNKTSAAYSFNTDYIYWLPKSIKIKNVLYVGQLPDPEVLGMFEHYEQVGVVENEFSREHGTKIFLLLGAKSSAFEMFYEIAEERKRNFDIF
tara:strand:- start:15037 stop:16581 length:1545 start_codon:yes stop_codon:yes gene_type:complete